MRFSIVTVSDTCTQGKRKDESGPTIVSLIKRSKIIANPTIYEPVIVPDERAMIESVLIEKSKVSDVIITTGGTGCGKRDVTPEATINVVDRRCTGLEVALHSHSLRITPMAALSRAVAGLRGSTLIVNFPGSVKAVKEYWEALEPVLNHAVNLLCDYGHDFVHASLAKQDQNRSQNEC